MHLHTSKKLSFLAILALIFIGVTNGNAQTAAPVLKPASGTFNTISTVLVSCTTSGAEMHYTTDGTAPTTDGPLVPASGLVSVGRNLSLKVTAWAGGTASSTAQGDYVVAGSLVAGQQFALALRFDTRKVWAWGENGYGQLGTGNTTASNLPLQVNNSSTASDYMQGVVMLAAGSHHSLALKNDGTVWSWGINNYGQLGNGTTANQLYPGYVQKAGPVNLSGIIQIASVWDTSFALKGSDGSIWAWGNNNSGQTGTSNTSANIVLAQQIKANSTTNFTGAIQIAAGNSFAMALKSDGTVWVWGTNAQSQFGSSSNTSSNSIYPVQVTVLSGIVAIAAGSNSCYALGSDGTVWAWGDNGYGQLANGNTTSQATPARMKTASATNITGVTAIAGGFRHFLALKSDGSIWAVGWNSTGQLAYNGSHTNSSYLIRSRELNADGSNSGTTNFVQISAGANLSLALKTDGTVYSWGANGYGQLGTGAGTTDVVYAKSIKTTAFPELANHVPTISLSISTGPYYQTGTLILTASPSDADAITGATNGLSIVKFFDGATAIGTLSDAPWSWNVVTPVLGNHNFSAQVVDEVGAPAVAGVISLTVSYDPTLDTDGDGIPDVWEMANGFDINNPDDALVDSDQDGLSNLAEYILSLNPNNPDTNNNGILDGMEDADGDGIANGFEASSDLSSVNNAAIQAAPTFIVDSTGGGNYIDLQTAIDAVTADYQSIQINDGVYSGAIAVYGHKILIYSKNGAGKTVLALNGATAGFYISSECILRGITFRDGIGDQGNGIINGGNIFVQQASPTFERCVISNGTGDDGAAIVNNYGHPLFLNCTITHNHAANSAIYSWGYSINLNNCILWDTDCAAEINGVALNAQQCIIKGGASGNNLNVDPLVRDDGHLQAGSPAIDAASSAPPPSSCLDMDGESQHGSVSDIGADEYWDADQDGLPNWWELLNAASGLDCTNAADAQTDPDQTGFTFLQIYQAGSAY